MRTSQPCNAFCAALSVFAFTYSSPTFAQTETEVPVARSSPPTITAVQPINPTSSKPGAPVIQSISAQKPEGPLAIVSLVSTQFHFVAPNGNAAVLHRDVTGTNGTNTNPMPNQAINVPADQQKRGAIATVLSPCTDNSYFVTYKVFIIDAEGNRSNEVQYTLHCNGG